MRGKKNSINKALTFSTDTPYKPLHMDYRLIVMRGHVCPCCYDELSHTASSLSTLTEKPLWFNLLFFKTQLLSLLFLFFNNENKAFLRAFFIFIKTSLVVKIIHMLVVLLKDAQTFELPFFLFAGRPLAHNS